MGNSYKGLLDSIFKKQELRYDDVSLYLHRPTATDSSMAPEGHECFYVLSPVPNLKSGVSWEENSNKFKNFIYEKLEETCLPNLREHIVSEKVLHPDHFATDYKSQFGSGFSIAPTLKQSACQGFTIRVKTLRICILLRRAPGSRNTRITLFLKSAG